MRTLLATLVLAASLVGIAAPATAEIRRDPNGVNVNSQGATSVFITFGGLQNQVPVEALWCGELIPATPDIGMKCDPTTIFGRLPIRFDQSRLDREPEAAVPSVLTDIMTIPPSVARRAYQAAARGETSTFFYVRRFESLVGGPDEYVFVTCRLAGGGARVPLALLDVALAFELDRTVLAVERGETPPRLQATIAYNGSGRLKGRWEVVFPSDEPPTRLELLTEGSLTPEERALARRYTELSRFNVFLPPTGRITLEGPDPSLLPTSLDGPYQLLLRIEATDDKEADSNLASAGAGSGVIHAGGVAGFALPTLRYFVGSAPPQAGGGRSLSQVGPLDGAELDVAEDGIELSWVDGGGVAVYLVEVRTPDGEEVGSAYLQYGIGRYRLPGFLLEGHDQLRWRVSALDSGGQTVAATGWSTFSVRTP